MQTNKQKRTDHSFAETANESLKANMLKQLEKVAAKFLSRQHVFH